MKGGCVDTLFEQQLVGQGVTFRPALESLVQHHALGFSALELTGQLLCGTHTQHGASVRKTSDFTDTHHLHPFQFGYSSRRKTACIPPSGPLITPRASSHFPKRSRIIK